VTVAPLMIVSGSSRVRTAAPLNHALYAATVGVPYFFDVAPTRVDRIYFHKLEVIRAYLPLAEWLFWIDDDAFFTDFDVDLRRFLADVGDRQLVFCKSPVNPRGGWTWMSSGQFFIRNTPQTLDLLDRVARTDLAAVKAWWDSDRYGLFTNGDQDAFVYQLQGPGADWGERFLQLPADAFNNRPYHYEQRLDEHFICHFALPGGRRPKADLIAEFADRLGTNVALVPPELIEPYGEFLDYSDMGGMLGRTRADAAPAASAKRATSRPNPVERASRRAARAVRSALRR
jgi:galactosyl transferase GMA12/MNN10 family